MLIIKIIGMASILISTTKVGFIYASFFNKRTQQLRQWQVALNILAAEITYGQTPLAIACKRISKQTAYPIANFFTIFAEEILLGKDNVAKLFAQSLQRTWKQTALSTEEYNVLLQLGESLGLHDPGSQEKQITLTREHLQAITETAIIEQQKNEKVFRTLGVLGGILLVVLLL